MTSAQVCILISIAVYLIAMLAIGIVCSKRNNTVDDFYLGGRRLGPVVTAMSAEASDMSSWLLMGLPGVAYLTGVADPGWTAIGLGVGTYINWLVVARRLRRYSARIGAITVPDFFSRRFGEKKHILTAMAAILIIVFFVPYTASGFAACGKLFGTLFGMDYHVAMIISAIVIVGYTATGGFTAASTTDLVQSVVMSIALVVVLVFGVSKAGGVGAVVENAQSMSGYLSMTATYDPESGKSATYNLLKILSTAAWGLGYFGMPHILLRFMAIEDDRKLKTSRRIATIWVVISMFIAVVIGVVGSAMVKNGAMGALADKETIIVQIANLLSQHGVVAALLAGVILAGILASTMSTADSQLLAASSGAIIVGFNVRPDAAARDGAVRQNVDMRMYRVIYDCIDEIEAAMKGMLAPKYREVVLGHAEVRQTYKVSSVGTVAGCYVQDGKIVRSCSVRVVRDGIVIHEGSLASLKRFKDDAREVAENYECGLTVEKFNDIKEGDIIEAFTMEEIPR